MTDTLKNEGLAMLGGLSPAKAVAEHPIQKAYKEYRNSISLNIDAGCGVGHDFTGEYLLRKEYDSLKR